VFCAALLESETLRTECKALRIEMEQHTAQHGLGRDLAALSRMHAFQRETVAAIGSSDSSSTANRCDVVKIGTRDFRPEG
jgi:hypothetical protein